MLAATTKNAKGKDQRVFPLQLDWASLWQRLCTKMLPCSSFSLAADLYRDSLKRGLTIRNTMDCLIAACAIDHSVPLLQHENTAA
jgi:hypothetical protein